MSTTPSRIHPKAIRARRNRRLGLFTLTILAIAIIYAGYWWFYARFWIWTDNAFVTGNLIPLEAQAHGIITQVLTEETQIVKKGDLLITLDAHVAQADLGRTQGRLGETVRKVAGLFAQRREVEQRLQSRSAQLALVRHDVIRYRKALPSGAISKQILQNAVDNMNSLQADVMEIQSQLDAIVSQVGKTTIREHPSVITAKNEMISAYLEYVRQNLLAPSTGLVAKRKAQVGDRVMPGNLLLTIVPLDHVWVEVNVRETELRQIRPGQSVLVYVDTYGDHYTYHGTVEGIVPGTGAVFALLPPDNAVGNFIHIVQRVPVRIGLPREELLQHPLRLGLSTITHIHVSEKAQPLISSTADYSTQEYKTNIYDNELIDAEAMAKGIIDSNIAVEGLDEEVDMT
ncbi:HlyD family secretion protein [Candidatus Nitrosacidococcus tergens]|uniref:Secretion protein HlyD family n=1 Tax=Candidatus Nitrosacidococcus tergens TaxID=553981 RepID=A0A7G1QA47_9GAMM|nr:HlyD family secretion protein [Candidatus Nitrosacidococcus tergens]CAB1276438.1 Secretion protein HlyD family [Candidatus Nitrosacidococcus tergens]